MKIKLFIIIFFCSCLQYSCYQRKDSSCIVEEYDILVNEENIKDIVSEFNECHIIPLDTLNDCQISSADKVIVTDSNILVSQIVGTSKLFSFDKNGKFLNCIGKIGHSKSEVTTILDVCANGRGDNFYILDWNAIKVFSANGTFKEAYQLSDSVAYRYIYGIDNGIACVSKYSGSSNLVHLYDEEFELYDQFVNTNSTVLNETPYMSNQLWFSHDKMIFYDFFASTFYVKDMKLNTMKIIRLKSDNILSVDKVKNNPEEYYGDYIQNFWFDGKNIWGTFVYDRMQCMFQLDTSSLKFTFCDDYDFIPNIYTYNNGWYYLCVTPEYLLRIQSSPSTALSKYDLIISKELQRSGINVKENDNYYILMMK